MSTAPDDDALRWEGDDDPTPDEVVADAPAEQQGTSAALLVVYGVLAGVFLIYTIGWLSIVTGSTVQYPDVLGNLMYQLGELLAILAPAAWMTAVFALTRGRRVVVRLVWLLIGVVVVLPWPALAGAGA